MQFNVRSIRVITLSVLVLSVLALAPAAFGAASFVPTRPIEFVCPSAAGGGLARFSETVGSIMESEKFVPVAMPRIYKPGGGFAVAMAYISEKKGNPHFLMSTSGPFVLTPLTVTLSGKKTITHRDLTMIGIMGFDEVVMVVKNDAPWKDMKELLAAAKAKPKSIRFGGSYVGSPDSLVVASIAKAAGVEFLYVPFQGGGEMNAALLGGHIDIMSSSPSDMMPHVEAKTMRMLAVAADKRIPRFKDMPTLKEIGCDLVRRTHRGIAAPPGISAEAVAYYENAARKVTETGAFKKYLDDGIMTPVFMGSTQASKFLDEYADVALNTMRDLGMGKK
ncbi:MAG: tripartite tricarboxylate transporter substrate binding protein [Deltaproteobacteria bacterium]